jgi:hypothetical protein
MAESALTVAELHDLREIAGTMVPADAALGMPGADDPSILADIVTAIGRDLALVREALAGIKAKAGGNFSAIGQDEREALINEWYVAAGKPATALGRAVLGAYYRDDRVLKAVGHEARAPFPKGYEVEQGDWSLVEVVRKRPPFWRDDGSQRGKR